MSLRFLLMHLGRYRGEPIEKEAKRTLPIIFEGEIYKRKQSKTMGFLTKGITLSVSLPLFRPSSPLSIYIYILKSQIDSLPFSDSTPSFIGHVDISREFKKYSFNGPKQHPFRRSYVILFSPPKREKGERNYKITSTSRNHAPAIMECPPLLEIFQSLTSFSRYAFRREAEWPLFKQNRKMVYVSILRCSNILKCVSRLPLHDFLTFLVHNKNEFLLGF